MSKCVEGRERGLRLFVRAKLAPGLTSLQSVVVQSEQSRASASARARAGQRLRQISGPADQVTPIGGQAGKTLKAPPQTALSKYTATCGAVPLLGKREYPRLRDVAGASKQTNKQTDRQTDPSTVPNSSWMDPGS